MTPSVIIIIIVAHVLNKFKESQAVQSIFYALRPAVTGLIAVAGFGVFEISVLTLDRFEITKTGLIFSILKLCYYLLGFIY